MIYKEIKGNLFEIDDKYTLCQCVSIDNAWGLGIAYDFDKNFKGMKNLCKKIVRENDLKTPSVIYYNTDRHKQAVFNLYTKTKCTGKPTYDTMRECIKIMANMCKEKNIKYLAMPKLGSGLDRLSWGMVREIIQDYFKDIDIELLLVRCKK